MIHASEALALPSAQLTVEEITAADKLEAEIEAHIRQEMKRGGCDFAGTESRGNVLAEINQRLLAAGYAPQWKLVVEQHRLNKALSQTIGFTLALSPSNEAYRVASRSALS